MAYSYIKIAMPTLLENVVRHDWGFYSREEQRMHLQTLHTKRDDSIKVFLESRGKRVFELESGSITNKEFKELKEVVDNKRTWLEEQWLDDCLTKGWIVIEKFDYNNQIIYVSLYTGHNKIVRAVNLKKLFPWSYSEGRFWGVSGGDFFLDQKNMCINVGKEADKKLNKYLNLSDVLFVA
jgi:hypothetical protein